ncbi:MULTISPECIES: ABC transporter substrate-binding protein [Herbiconiux]|uniref:Peptide/nickel transport system substrate-binding protein n=1 Tax=Herbiconiux flava TaxID=881268 RepID=A0A852SAM8_9MICO|nr:MULTISPECIES: ABC transporter substrate-binding protein [Herbiconiux]NQX35043.1 ABC transporter substrate-binding protein [Herbiconiux sp. VKM Ac-2851]NYD69396.1 peptide/nickel transport system substrate-binding protein [Herbiconiux flava]GLK16141.1 peptide ABC transporter substrate-binding protein [Herbiconiux flava]
MVFRTTRTTRSTPTRVAIAAAAVSLTLLVAGCSSGRTDTADSGTQTLTINKAFDLKTADPGRMYEPTGQLVDKALYETLLTFEGGDVSKVVDGLASLEQSDDAKTFTLTLTGEHTFSDGTAMTADDVVFSLQRVIGLKGNPSFLLDGVTVTKQDDKTVVLTTETPTPALPAILANPALGILNSKVVKENGGTTDETDTAEKFLNTTSAGSGPYVLDTLDLASQVVLTANENYDGDAPGYGRVVIQNVEGATQKINVEGGSADVALDLSGTQAEALGDSVEVTSDPSANVIFLLLNQNPSVSAITSNPDFVKAVKEAIDYDDLVSIAGTGTAQASGVVPSMLLGALPESGALTQDLDAAKADLAKSGYAGESVTLNFPSDISLNGIDFPTIAQRIQSQLKDAGITVELAPAPVATELDAYRNGTETMGLWYWGPDYPDPSDYLVFTPGNVVGLRSGWAEGANPAISTLADAAAAGGSDEERQSRFEELQTALNADGPFIPLLQPGNNIAAAKDVTGVVYNAVWTIDIAALAAK